MRRRPSVQQAFDEARFGATRILNVRDPLLSGAEAVRRADGWLRAKQVECAGEVLIVTGRGAGSVDQVPVVREEVRKLLARLRRGGVVSDIREHTPGSFAVRLAPMRALFEAPPRSRDGHDPRRRTPGKDTSTGAPAHELLAGLSPATRDLLHRLAVHALHALGLADPDERYVQGEMARKFSVLTRAAAASGAPLSEAWLRDAIARALDEYENELR
jgi:hypothetical protein